jgi:hypothetical protein
VSPVARDWVSYTEEALDRFYPGVAGRFPEGWPLFAGGELLASLDDSELEPDCEAAWSTEIRDPSTLTSAAT